MSCFVWAGDKGKKEAVKYTKKSTAIAALEKEMDDVVKKEAEANKFIADFNKQKIFLQGKYAVYVTLPDSFIVQPDSTAKQ